MPTPPTGSIVRVDTDRCPPSAGLDILLAHGHDVLTLTITGGGGGALDYIVGRIGDSDHDEQIIWGDIEPGVLSIEPRS